MKINLEINKLKTIVQSWFKRMYDYQVSRTKYSKCQKR